MRHAERGDCLEGQHGRYTLGFPRYALAVRHHFGTGVCAEGKTAQCARNSKLACPGLNAMQEHLVSETPSPASQCLPRPDRRVIILVIILVFVLIMAASGYAPAMALGLAVAAVAAADGKAPSRYSRDS
jgi:hypothetical protein